MALCRCKEHSPPEGRRQDYIGFVLPVGYPDTALVCGLCEKPGVIWLTSEEIAGFKKGERIFAGPNKFAKMRTNDEEVKNKDQIYKI